MKAYIETTQLMLNIMGVLQLKGNNKKSNKILNFIVIVTSIVMLGQMMANMLINSGSLDEKTLLFIMFLFWMQSLGKLITLIANRDRLKKIFQYLEALMQNLNPNQDNKSRIFMRRMYKVNLGMIKLNILTAVLFLSKPIIVMLLIYFKTGEIVLDSTPYQFWYPFEKVSYKYYLTYLYEIYAGVIISVFPFATDQFFLILIALLSTQFKSFGNNLFKAIEEKKDNITIKKEIKKFVETHNELIEIGNFLNRMYSIPLFIHILTATFIICMVEFMVVV